MITVAGILALPALTRTELAAPCDGFAARHVRNVGVMDYAPDVNRYDDYFPGEFIFSNLGFACGDERVIERSVIAMLERNVSALAVKTLLRPSINQTVLDASTALGVPLIWYEGEYYEVILYQAIDLIKRDERESNKGRELDALLSEHDAASIRAALYEIAGLTGSSVRCLCLSPRSSDECSLYASLDALTAALDKLKAERGNVEAVFACRYHDCLLGFVSFAHSELGPFPRDPTRLLESLRPLGSMLIGVGEEVALRDGDLTIRQALAAHDMARSSASGTVLWSETQESGFRYAIRSDRMLMQMCADRIGVLSAYDADNDADLLPTAIGYIANHGDAKKTAEDLHQHPNTVRYRMRKAKELLGKDDATDREFYEYLYLIMLGR